MIYICDNGLIDVGSHSCNLVAAILRGFAEIGQRVEILAYQGVSDDVRERLNVRPHFERHLYEGESTDPATWEVDSWLSLNASFFADLRKIESELANPAHTLLFPGLTQHQILGLARWVTSLPERRRPKIVVQLMFHPSWTVWGATTPLGPLFYKNAGKILRPLVGSSVFLGCENEDMAKLYSDLFGLPVEVLPIPTLPLSPGLERKPGKTLNLAFLGYSKAEKGFHLLPEAVRQAQAAGLPVRFIIQTHHGGWEEETVQAEIALRSSGDNVVLLNGAMPPETYFRVFSMADVILLPYDPEQYRARGSGILSEAASYGKPVVATPGTWMAAAAARSECTAVILKSFDSVSLFEGISAAVANFSALNREAAARAVNWHNVNNSHNYCMKVAALGTDGMTPGKVYFLNHISKDDLNPTNAPDYQLGDTVLFGKTPGWQKFVGKDLSEGLAENVPVGASGVELIAKMRAPCNDLELEIELASMGIFRELQEISVSFNGHWVATVSNAAIYSGRAVVRLPRGLFGSSTTFRICLRPLWSADETLPPLILLSFQIRDAGTDDGADRPGLPCNMTIAPSLADTSPLEFESGWSEPEASGRWAVEPIAVIGFTPSLPLNFSGGGFSLVLDVMIPVMQPAQTVTLYLDDLIIGVFRVESIARITCELPLNALRHKIPARLALESAHTYVAVKDPRSLRIQLRSLTVTSPEFQSLLDEPVECYRLGERLEFGRGGSATPYLRSGWSEQEAGHCWIAGTEADLVFTMGTTVQAPALTGEVSILPGGERVTFEIWVNGKLIERFAPKVEELCQFTLPLPASAFSIGERTFIRFKASHTVRAPGDIRDLSICVYNLLIKDIAPSQDDSAPPP